MNRTFSALSLIRNVRIENLELDFHPDRLMPRMQHKDATRFERFKAKACELARVNNYRYGPHHPATPPTRPPAPGHLPRTPPSARYFYAGLLG